MSAVTAAEPRFITILQGPMEPYQLTAEEDGVERGFSYLEQKCMRRLTLGGDSRTIAYKLIVLVKGKEFDRFHELLQNPTTREIKKQDAGVLLEICAFQEDDQSRFANALYLSGIRDQIPQDSFDRAVTTALSNRRERLVSLLVQSKQLASMEQAVFQRSVLLASQRNQFHYLRAAQAAPQAAECPSGMIVDARRFVWHNRIQEGGRYQTCLDALARFSQFRGDSACLKFEMCLGIPMVGFR